ncbi:hypothetical protein PJ267_09140 [Arthrobacter sp. OVS8]|nr:hypothetical protein PJ267_09140 [Arthrobacter sp. OVS8]
MVPPEGADELFLVRYIIGRSVGCQYRTNGQWLNISQPLDEHAWFFLNAPGGDWSLYDLSQSDESGIGVEVGYLTEQAVAWYDHEGDRSAIAYEIFGAKEQQLFVRRLSGSSDLEVELATQGLLWNRGSEGQWTLKDDLTLGKRFQRSVLVEHARNLLQESSSHFPRASEGAARDFRIAAALALGAPFRVIPTFDALLFRLVDESKLTWESVRPILTCSAEASLISNENNDEVSGIALQSGSHTWLRHRESWVRVEGKPSFGRLLLPLAIDNLAEAVDWWDCVESVDGTRSTPPHFSSSSVQFVSEDDPGRVPNFSIRDLVRGSMDTGYGEARRAGVWEHGYWPVLDYENHLPADEGDPTPGAASISTVSTRILSFLRPSSGTCIATTVQRKVSR